MLENMIRRGEKMAVYILIIVIILISSIKLRYQNNLNNFCKSDTILCKSDTTTINGICALLIFLSHSTQYWPLSSGFFDNVYGHVQNIHNQWVVAPFLAFSGYGVMLQIMKSCAKREYVRSYPYKRLLKTLINFDIAVVLYWVVSFLLGIQYEPSVILGSLFGITSVGNSNWYIFAILILYIFSYIAALIFKGNYKSQVLLISFLCVGYCLLMWIIGFEMRFYSTAMCYSLGAFIALEKEKIVEGIRKKKMITIFLLMLVILLTYKLRFNAFIMNISSVTVVLAIVWFLCFFEIKSKVLYFFGKHAFGIFILQRIPGLIFYNLFGDGANKYVVIITDFTITIIIAMLYDEFLYYVDRKIINLIEGKNKDG